MLPQDVQYSDIDYMERQLDFTLNPRFAGFPALITRMKADGLRVVLILVSAHVEGGFPRLEHSSMFGKVGRLWWKRLYVVCTHVTSREADI